MDSVAEIWKPLNGEASNYEASNQGRIRRISDGRMSPQYNDKDGYKLTVIKCSETGKNRTRRVHRLIASVFVEGYRDGLKVNHINGIKYDNRASNLEWCTEQENRWHAIKTGLVRTRKLSNAEAEEVRYYRRNGITCIALAEIYDVSEETIRMIGTGQQYKFEVAV